MLYPGSVVPLAMFFFHVWWHDPVWVYFAAEADRPIIAVYVGKLLIQTHFQTSPPLTAILTNTTWFDLYSFTITQKNLVFHKRMVRNKTYPSKFYVKLVFFLDAVLFENISQVLQGCQLFQEVSPNILLLLFGTTLTFIIGFQTNILQLSDS